MLQEPDQVLDPLGDVETGSTKNRAKAGSARPSSLLYTYGPGAVMDLPGFSVMPAGLDDWEPIWKRRQHIPTITEPRLLQVVRLHLGPQVDQLRPFPWQPKANPFSPEGTDLGIPARVFPQWLRCTGCDYLGPIPRFHYQNTHPFRPDLAQFTHQSCPGRGRGRDASRGSKRKRESPAVPARHLLTCANGHLDEFPYTLWVHRGGTCPKAETPSLKMRDANVGAGIGSRIFCQACGESRGMNEAQGKTGAEKLPQACRGRHPHLNAFDASCDARPALIMMGASNLWFASTQSVIVMPRSEQETKADLADRLRLALGDEVRRKYADQPEIIRDLAGVGGVDLSGFDDSDLEAVIAEAFAPVDTEEERQDKLETWDPVELRVPEWLHLQKEPLFSHQEDGSGLMVTKKERGDKLPSLITRVIAVDKMKKVNAVLGFTRLDEIERAGDLRSRLVKLTRDGRPAWVPATEDRGEGVFLQLDLAAVQEWDQKILDSDLWADHTEAHRRNFERRFSETAKKIASDERLPPPRYWLLHTLAHVLIREMAMHCGYGGASLSERIYAWAENQEREAAAGLLICTTSSDSDGTLGGLVALSEPDRLQQIVTSALRRAARCSSDPVCAMRTPSDPEDFLHGAACHCCAFASETSCERANRFLDRRFLLTLPADGGAIVPGFFGAVDAR